MYHYLKGKPAMKLENAVVLDVNDVGYLINIPANSAAYLAAADQKIMLYTRLIVREDDVSLYGFDTEDTLDLFLKLMTVGGVGAKAAMAILSSLSVGEIKKAIVFDDAATLTRAQGIGKKIAQRIVLELKEKVGTIGGLESRSVERNTTNARLEAIEGLCSLGYSKSEAMEAVARVGTDNSSTEELMKQALKGLTTRA